ncbi:MAG: hypothetical protein ACM3UR_12550 [Bacteroidota bacterium]|jgi:hypothetical protein|nr:hypothetical protein [Ignavibacteria bacterium]MCU7498492.1 hypothetical protein [Ignavibacteria bacterium]MCU7512610.1 hypothetical protein [Ignavibacteria bacterium]MCU7521218.1 hypothetical protein [Ignavibacteria bacterium]MCU7525058.1 hypothetical protein [Ignavibacteria bacterium]
MGGKASIYMVLGFSLIFLVASMNYGRLTGSAVDNNVEYYKNTVAHNIAVSGANMAANEIFLDKNWNAGYTNLPFSSGKINVTVEDAGQQKKRITSTGEFQGISKKVVILLQPSGFSKYAYYTNIFPGNTFLATGDTITGPFHTQGKLNVKGSPVFQGKASAKNGLKLVDKNTSPKFYGGFESGVDVPLNWSTSDTKAAAQAGGYVFNAGGAGKVDVRLTFNGNATVTYSRRFDSGSWNPDTTVSLSAFAPNGVIYVEKGNLYLKGVVSGKYTVIADQSSGNGTGNVYIEDDIRYKSNPLTNPSSTDMLGIISSNNVLISDNLANRFNVNIDATIFAYKGGLGLVNESMPYSGTMKVFGGVVEYQGRTTGVYSGNMITNGYRERIIFDERLMLNSPPYFPATDKYEVVSWLE